MTDEQSMLIAVEKCNQMIDENNKIAKLVLDKIHNMNKITDSLLSKRESLLGRIANKCTEWGLLTMAGGCPLALFCAFFIPIPWIFLPLAPGIVILIASFIAATFDLIIHW